MRPIYLLSVAVFSVLTFVFIYDGARSTSIQTHYIDSVKGTSPKSQIPANGDYLFTKDSRKAILETQIYDIPVSLEMTGEGGMDYLNQEDFVNYSYQSTASR